MSAMDTATGAGEMTRRHRQPQSRRKEITMAGRRSSRAGAVMLPDYNQERSKNKSDIAGQKVAQLNVAKCVIPEITRIQERLQSLGFFELVSAEPTIASGRRQMVVVDCASEPMCVPMPDLKVSAHPLGCHSAVFTRQRNRRPRTPMCSCRTEGSAIAVASWQPLVNDQRANSWGLPTYSQGVHDGKLPQGRYATVK